MYNKDCQRWRLKIQQMSVASAIWRGRAYETWHHAFPIPQDNVNTSSENVVILRNKFKYLQVWQEKNT